MVAAARCRVPKALLLLRTLLGRRWTEGDLFYAHAPRHPDAVAAIAAFRGVGEAAAGANGVATRRQARLVPATALARDSSGPGLGGAPREVRAQQARAGGAALAALALHAGRADATRRGFFLALCQVRPQAARWQATAAWRTGLSGGPLAAGGPLRDGAPLPAARASHVPAPGEGLARGERGAACV